MRLDKVAQRVSALLEVSEKSQRQIAEEIGYDRPNIIAMFKMGATKVPLTKIGPLAKALNADPGHMMRLALETYSPETYEAIKDHLGDVTSEHEREILKVIRKASGNGDPKLTTKQEEALEKLFAK